MVDTGGDEATELGPGTEVRYLLLVSMGSPAVIRVQVNWDDDSAEPGMWSSQLTLS
jgi:hypothetical protein